LLKLHQYGRRGISCNQWEGLSCRLANRGFRMKLHRELFCLL